MTKYLCESCAHLIGEPRRTTYIDTAGTERRLECNVKVRCAVSKGWTIPAVEKQHPRRPLMDCAVYKRKKE